jgi:hypothetical protein
MRAAQARILAKVEHPFIFIKRQFGYRKVRYRGSMKITQQLHTLPALSNLWMARRPFADDQGMSASRFGSSAPSRGPKSHFYAEFAIEFRCLASPFSPDRGAHGQLASVSRALKVISKCYPPGGASASGKKSLSGYGVGLRKMAR